jgi:hypothetical protein
VLQVLTKARSREALLLARQEVILRDGWQQYLTVATRAPDVRAALANGDVEAVLRGIDRAFAAFTSGWNASFLDMGKITAAYVARKLPIKKARPTVAVSFDQVDPLAVDAMQRNKLRLIRNISQQQRNLIRPILVRGITQGLGPLQMARELKHVIGLDEQGMQGVRAFERAQREGRAEELEVPEAGRGPVLSDSQMQGRVEQVADNWRRIRAERIARTEATRVVSEAQDVGLRQSINAIGQSAQLTGKIWRSVNDGRTRERHAERDGTRLRLDQEFAPGVLKPGDGPGEEGINCRCVLEYFFADNEAEMTAWLGGSS